MRVDVVDVRRLDAVLGGLAHGDPHGIGRATAGRMRRGHVIGVVRVTVADDLGVDVRAARQRMFQRFEHQDRRPLAHHEAVAVAVKGPARRLRIVAALAQRAHDVKGRHGDGQNGRLASTRHHHIRVAAAQQLEGLATRRRAAGAGTHHRVIGPLQVVVDGNLAARAVHEHVGNHERAHLAQPLLARQIEVLAEAANAADAAANDHADARGVLRRHVQAGVGHGLLRGNQRVLDARIETARFFAIHVLARIEVAHLAGKRHAQV